MAALVAFIAIALVILPGALCSGFEWQTHKVRRVTGLALVTVGAIVVLDHLSWSTRAFVIAVLMGLAWGLIERLARQSGDS